MNIHKKPNQQILAETAAYIDDTSLGYEHTQALKENMANTALRLTTGESVVTQGLGGWHIVDNKLVDIIETHEHATEDYVAFLRSLKPEQRQDIGFLADKLEAYETFRPEVEVFLEASSEQSDHYLGRGSNGRAYHFVRDNISYAIKRGGVNYSDIPAFRRAEDIEGISHLVAVDIETDTAIMNLVPGKRADRLNEAECLAIPDAHIHDVIDKVLEMHDAGLVIDGKASNFLYDPDEGFGIIDYLDMHGKNIKIPKKAAQVFGLCHMLLARPEHDIKHTYGSPEYAEIAHHNRIVDISIMNTFLDILESDYPEIIQEGAVIAESSRNDPRRTTFGMLVTDIYALPSGEPYDSFRDRVLRLGIQGDTPYQR